MGRRFTSKGRTYKTNKNKLRKLKKFYRLTFKHSKKNFESNTASGYKYKTEGQYFFIKYPNETSFLNKIKIKQSNKEK